MGRRRSSQHPIPLLRRIKYRARCNILTVLIDVQTAQRGMIDGLGILHSLLQVECRYPHSRLGNMEYEWEMKATKESRP